MEEEVEYGAEIIVPNPPEKEGSEFQWADVPETMPANDIIIYGTYTIGIDTILARNTGIMIFTTSGRPLNAPQKGVNIILYKDGKAKKVISKYR
jgi:hypothetical protein